MKYIKKYKLIIIIMVFIMLLPVTITLSRYVTTKLSDYILESKRFFFNSDKLTANNKRYEINNWSGTDPISIQFDLNNRKNNLLFSDMDIEYELSVTCDTDVTCNITNTSGVIYKNDNSVTFNLIINPKRVFGVNETVTIKVKGKSTSPYIKELSATFIIKVGVQGLTYDITDSLLSPYLMFNITNTRQSYFAREVYNNYNIGDEITTEDYLKLSDDDKKHFSSARITLSFDPKKVLLDTTSDITNNSTKLYTEYNGISYISSITFDIDALSSTSIRFYKQDTNNNYTYPIVNSSSIINFTAV